MDEMKSRGTTGVPKNKNQKPNKGRLKKKKNKTVSTLLPIIPPLKQPRNVPLVQSQTPEPKNSLPPVG